MGQHDWPDLCNRGDGCLRLYAVAMPVADSGVAPGLVNPRGNVGVPCTAVVRSLLQAAVGGKLAASTFPLARCWNLQDTSSCSRGEKQVVVNILSNWRGSRLLPKTWIGTADRASSC
jgi:hypothetical protein